MKSALAARGGSPAAFDERRILAIYVAPPSNTGGIFGRRALFARRLTSLGATLDFHHGLLAWSKGRNVFVDFGDREAIRGVRIGPEGLTVAVYMTSAAFVVLMLAGVAAQQTAPPSTPTTTLSYEFFKTDVQPIFLNERAGHARCVACHGHRTTPLVMQPLAPGRTTWTEEESRRNFEAIQHLVTPGDLESPLLVHALEETAGGDFYHNGGKHFASKNDPEWIPLKTWVLGQTARQERRTRR